MIKIEHIVTASPEQMEFIIEGMRNPMNSWDKSDSHAGHENMGTGNEYFHLGENDRSLMQRLSNAGTDHRKFMRMMPVYMRITAPLYWYKELDTYKVGTVANSCSTMHRLTHKPFEVSDFSFEHLDIYALEILNNIIRVLNTYRDLYVNYESNAFEIENWPSKKDIWWQMIQLLPSSYNQTRNVMLNYEVLANIYKSRKDHKLDEWREFCRLIKTLPHAELITGGR